MRAVRSICNLLVGATSLVGACTVPPASQQPANPAAATAQNKNANVAIRGAISGEKQKIQFIYFINPDCTSAGLVKISVTEVPAHGSVTTEPLSDFPAFEKENVRFVCNTRRVAGLQVFYQSEPGFVGSDKLTIDVVYPNGLIQRVLYGVIVR